MKPYDDDVVNLIKVLYAMDSSIIIGGSFALNLYGILNREIHDIDIITDQSLIDNPIVNYPSTAKLMNGFYTLVNKK